MNAHKSQAQPGKSEFDDPFLICPSLELFPQNDAVDRICDVAGISDLAPTGYLDFLAGNWLRKLRGPLAEFPSKDQQNIADGRRPTQSRPFPKKNVIGVHRLVVFEQNLFLVNPKCETGP
jgi:hypothetical protein